MALPALAAVTLLAAFAPLAPMPAQAHEDCPHFDLDDLRGSLDDVAIVVIGEMTTEAGSPAIAAEAYLKGAAAPPTLVLLDRPSECERAALPAAGARVLAALRLESGGYQWPVPAALFVLADGLAATAGESPVSLPEEELIARIRGVSGQYVTLAADASEGASINWLGVVLPVTLAAAVILGVALALLRIWHRIEPE